MINKLQGRIPDSLKPVLKPLYHKLILSPLHLRLKRRVVKPKTRNELWEFWRHPDPEEGRNLPTHYLRGEERSQFLVGLIKNYAAPEAKILEIGCNVGRNLNCLFNAGYVNLSAVEISGDAIDLMKQAYPEMARQIRLYNSPVEDIIKNLGDGAFSLIFTMAVLQHIHPDSESIFSEMARITNGYLITCEDEKGITWRHFPRNYKRVFESLGMKQVYQFNCGQVEALGASFWARVFAKHR